MVWSCGREARTADGCVLFPSASQRVGGRPPLHVMSQPDPNRIQPINLEGSPAPPQTSATPFTGDYVSSYLRSTFQTLQSNSTKELRPLSDFLAKDKFSLPGRDVVSRIKINLGFYSSNYAAIFIVLAIYCVFVAPDFSRCVSC